MAKWGLGWSNPIFCRKFSTLGCRGGGLWFGHVFGQTIEAASSKLRCYGAVGAFDFVGDLVDERHHPAATPSLLGTCQAHCAGAAAKMGLGLFFQKTSWCSMGSTSQLGLWSKKLGLGLGLFWACVPSLVCFWVLRSTQYKPGASGPSLVLVPSLDQACDSGDGHLGSSQGSLVKAGSGTTHGAVG